MAMVILLAELRMRRAEISGLMGGALGGVLGLLASLLITLVVSRTSEPEATKSFLEFSSLFALGYLGLGSCKGQHFRPTALSESAELPDCEFPPVKLLDTSALIAMAASLTFAKPIFSTVPSGFRALFCTNFSSSPIRPIP